MARKMNSWEKRVRMALLKKEMTCAELAKMLGISRVYLYDILVGSRNSPAYRTQIENILELNGKQDVECECCGNGGN